MEEGSGNPGKYRIITVSAHRRASHRERSHDTRTISMQNSQERCKGRTGFGIMPENKQPVFWTSSQIQNSAYRKIKRVLSFRKRVFGQRLEETLAYEQRYGARLVPLVVEQCIAFIRECGLREVGLFRQPGQTTLVKELQSAFDSGEKPPFDSSTDVHTVASLLKLYLRELPEPVIPFSHYQDFLMCAKGAPGGEKQAFEDLKTLLQKLPEPNFNLLHYICRFLNEVKSYSNVNKMSAENLATVFGLNIMRPKEEDPETMIGGTVLAQQLMSELIRESGRLFLRDSNSSLGPDSPPCQGQTDDLTAETHRDSPAHQYQPLPPSPPPPTLAPRNPHTDSPASPPSAQMDLRPPSHHSSPTRRDSDPLYDNCPSPGDRIESAEPRSSPPLLLPAPTAPTLLDGWDVPCWAVETGGRGSVSSSSENLVARNAHESTLSIYDNLDDLQAPSADAALATQPETVTQPPAPLPPEDSGDSSSWSSCEIVLEETKPSDPTPDFPPSVQALLTQGSPDLLAPSTSPATVGYLVAGLQQQLVRQKEEYEAQIRSLEKRNETLQGEVSSLRANLEQHRRWYKVAEIKMRNAERARADADRRNSALQHEMEQFFDTFGELNHEAKKTERIVQGF